MRKYKYIPNIVCVYLSRSLEKHLEENELGKVRSEFVIDNAKNTLKAAIDVFKEIQKDIGDRISNAVVTNKHKQVIVGICPICNNGDLIVKESSRTKKICRMYFTHL
jgi:glutamine synthetase type III